MHELSIADAVLHVALDTAGNRRIAGVGVAVGHLRQVVPSALHFSFELVARGTAADGAALEIEDVPAAGRCRVCGSESGLTAFPLHCAACGAFDVEIIRGEELSVEWIDLVVIEDGSAPTMEQAGCR